MSKTSFPSPIESHPERRLLRATSGAFLAAVMCLLVLPPGAYAADPEGMARGYPVLRDSGGKALADGDFVQWREGEKLHVRIKYRFTDGRRVEEQAIFRQKPRLVQESWSWSEHQRGKLQRHFQVNFSSGRVEAKKLEKGGQLKQWSKSIEVEPGRTFAGFGFTLAIKANRDRLVKGERIELKGIGFTPKPRVASVELSHGGLDHMRMAARDLRGDHFVIHPKVPWFAKLFVKVPDTHIWLTSPPAAFLRWEGPLAEVGDPMVRVDLLPGATSGPAKPVVASRRP
jgi:hypothetical protein